MTTLYTIGHSNKSLFDFIALLQAHKITHVVDVRTIPKSKKMPWFNQDTLKISLRKKKITYLHMPKLGGLRHTNKQSINQAWINLSFRGFADYMQTKGFYEGLKSLNQYMKGRKKVAIMCAEAVPWRCHRSLIADAEIVRHVSVLHIMSRTSIRDHDLTSFAVVNRNKRPIQVYYPKK